MRVLSLWLLIASGACNRAATAPESGVPDSEPSTARERPDAPASTDAPDSPDGSASDGATAPDSELDTRPPGATPGSDPATSAVEALYAECKDRLEGPEIDGECSTDADCMATGCSSEVCTTKASAGDMMTTCEVLPCFAAVDTCGCVEGRCRWSLADSAPEPKLIQLPPQ